MCIFPVVTKGSETLKYVFPSKQKEVQKTIEVASGNAQIERLILFGSAVTRNCGTDSDIDLAVCAPEMDEDAFLKAAGALRRAADSEMDILHYEKIRDAGLLEEIQRKGVTVYAKRT